MLTEFERIIFIYDKYYFSFSINYYVLYDKIIIIIFAFIKILGFELNYQNQWTCKDLQEQNSCG